MSQSPHKQPHGVNATWPEPRPGRRPLGLVAGLRRAWQASSEPGSVAFVWAMPVLLAVLTAVGLLLALLASDAWHAVAWLAVASPLLAVLWHWLRRTGGR